MCTRRRCIIGNVVERWPADSPREPLAAGERSAYRIPHPGSQLPPLRPEVAAVPWRNAARAEPQPPPGRRRRTYLGILLLGLIGALIFGGAYTGATVATEVLQAPATGGAPQRVVIQPGETTTQIAGDLEHRGLIRSALLFRLWARYRELDGHLQAGTFVLSPHMTMDQIVDTLEQSPAPPFVVIALPEGMRVLEYPAYLRSLAHFDGQQFLDIARTGQFPGRERYWYVAPPAPGVRYALEGYLFPSTYYVDPQATATAVIKQLLDGLGLQLCPGPSQDPYRYLFDQRQCQAHARVVDPATHLTIFDALRQRGLTLAQALTLASIVEREARSPGAKAGVASAYYNRYLAAAGAQPGPDNGGPITLDADPTVQYVSGTHADPWPALQVPARTVAPDDVFNTYTHIGLPPGPIAGCGVNTLDDVVAGPRTSYYYFITGADHQMHFARTYAQQQQDILRYGLG